MPGLEAASELGWALLWALAGRVRGKGKQRHADGGHLSSLCTEMENFYVEKHGFFVEFFFVSGLGGTVGITQGCGSSHTPWNPFQHAKCQSRKGWRWKDPVGRKLPPPPIKKLKLSLVLTPSSWWTFHQNSGSFQHSRPPSLRLAPYSLSADTDTSLPAVSGFQKKKKLSSAQVVGDPRCPQKCQRQSNW